MLAQLELNAIREQALIHLEQETGEKRHEILLKMFDFYIENYKNKQYRQVPKLSAEHAHLFEQIEQAKDFSDENAVYQRYARKMAFQAA
ncbi:MAG: hypothetical protein IKH45_00300 [Neisseriaceae bacterium]|nr:hypothetical protein [Neisseriaceae bacterium]